MADDSTLEKTVALLEATLQATHDGIVVVDLGGRVVLYNRHFLEMLRLEAGELEQGGVEWMNAALAPQLENADEIRETTRRLWTNPAHEIADTLRFRDGRVYARYVAPHRIDGRVVGVVASLRDVSQTVRIEQALEQHRTFLEKAQEVAQIGSWVADLDGGGRIGWSTETHRIFGVAAGRFDGTGETFFSFVHPEDRDAVRETATRARNTGTAFSIDHRIVRGDGTIRWVHEEADVIRDAQGHPARMVGTVQDVTERRQLQEQVLQSQKMEAIGRLAGGIAHDLNNALTAIAGYADLAIGQLNADHPSRADVEEIRRAAERAASVTRQLLAFSRKELLEPRVFSLSETVTSMGRLLSRLLGPDIAVRLRIAEHVPPILGDPGQIEQAIINLAVNARDAMPNGGELTLETLAEDVDDAFARAHVPMTAGRYTALRVTDTGHGMSPETQRRIFEPFFTTKDVGKGTGLGLSMVYGTVKQVGGFIFVDSEVGRGTTFSLFFPQAERARPPADAARIAADANPQPQPGGGETLLIAEDEPAVRNLVASSLRNAGYRLLLASSAEEALGLAASHEGRIDLLLTDAMMPGRSGFELARDLLAVRPGTPVILMSGYTHESLPAGSLDHPFSLLQKPFTPRDLRQRIREILDR